MKRLRELTRIFIGCSLILGSFVSYGARKKCQESLTPVVHQQGLSRNADRLLQRIISLQTEPLQVKPSKYINMIKALMRAVKDEGIASFAIRASFDVVIVHHKFTKKQILQLMGLVPVDTQKHIIHYILNHVHNADGVSINQQMFVELVTSLERRFPSIVGVEYARMANEYAEEGEHYLKLIEEPVEQAARHMRAAERYLQESDEHTADAENNASVPKHRRTVLTSSLYEQAVTAAARARVETERAMEISKEADKKKPELERQMKKALDQYEQMKQKAAEMFARASIRR